jgi:acetyl esterase/lipase
VTNPSVEDIPYRTIEGTELKARLYRPDTTGPAPFVIDAHGGAWGNGDRLGNEVIHQDFAEHGIGVFALDFRLSGEAQFPAPVDDVNYGVRWFKANTNALGVATSLIGGMGSSSGGQQMGLVALTPTDTRYTTPEASLSEVDASVAFFIACWPILDPLARYQKVQKEGNERLISAHKAYFLTEEDMKIGNPFMILDRGEATHRPPMIIIQGTADGNVEHTRADIFAERYLAAGGLIELHKFDGQPHSFITREPDTRATKDAIEKLRNFVLAQV